MTNLTDQFRDLDMRRSVYESRGRRVEEELLGADDRLKFPMPFGGVEYYVRAKDQRQLDEFVLRLMACDHQHHFCVSTQGIWVSRNAMDWGCLEGRDEPRVEQELAEAMMRSTAYDAATHQEVPCNVVWNQPCNRVEIEFTAPCTIDQGVHWIDDHGVVVFTWDVRRALNRGDIVALHVEMEDL